MYYNIRQISKQKKSKISLFKFFFILFYSSNLSLNFRVHQDEEENSA